jgi:ABC-type polar amino acid transport system ATPase subunit
LKKINETFHIPLILVTHHVEFARGLATRLLFMKEGRVLVDTAADELDRFCHHEEFRKYLEPMTDDSA